MNNDNTHLQSLISFLEKESYSTDLYRLFDELLYDYVSLVLELRTSGNDIHKDVLNFIYYLKMLRDLMPTWEEKRGRK